MEQDPFDSFVKSMAGETNRRRFAQDMLGLGAGATVVVFARFVLKGARPESAQPRSPENTSTSTCADIGSSCDSSGDCCSLCCVLQGGAAGVCALFDTCSMPVLSGDEQRAVDDRGPAFAHSP